MSTRGEFYADLDSETNTYCVFHTETSKAYASFADKADADADAKSRNKIERRRMWDNLATPVVEK